MLSAKGYSTNVGDEGGFAPDLKSTDEAMDVILQAIENAGYTPGEQIKLALDCAASEFYKDGVYKIEGKDLSGDGMVEYLARLAEKIPGVQHRGTGWTRTTGPPGRS